MNLLFICGRNQWRSPTAAKIFGRRAGLSVRSAGLSAKSPHTVNEGDLAWADVVFVMESEHRVRLRERFGRVSVEVCVLEIPDDYQFMDPELVHLLEERVGDWLRARPDADQG